MMINELHSLKRCFSHAVTLLSRRCHDGTLDSAGSLLSPKTYVSTFKLWCCFKQDLSIHCRGLWETHEFCARGNINSVKWYVPVLKCASVWCWRNYNHTVYDRMKWIIIHLQWLLLNTSGVEAPLFSVASVFDELILIFSIPTAFFHFFPSDMLANIFWVFCSASVHMQRYSDLHTKHSHPCRNHTSVFCRSKMCTQTTKVILFAYLT